MPSLQRSQKGRASDRPGVLSPVPGCATAFLGRRSPHHGASPDNGCATLKCAVDFGHSCSGLRKLTTKSQHPGTTRPNGIRSAFPDTFRLGSRCAWTGPRICPHLVDVTEPRPSTERDWNGRGTVHRPCVRREQGRPGRLATALRYLRRGDTMLVASMQRLTRSSTVSSWSTTSPAVA